MSFDTMNSVDSKTRLSVSGLLLVCLAGLSLGSCGFSLRKPLTVLISEGYTGWVRVEFNVASAPAYAEQNGRHVLKIPSSGFVQTSSSFEPGLEGDIYEYGTADGKPEPFPAGVSVHLPRMFTVNPPAEKQRIFGAFFVGTDADFAKATKDPSSLPLPKD